jgi:hypothetical protein
MLYAQRLLWPFESRALHCAARFGYRMPINCPQGPRKTKHIILD